MVLDFDVPRVSAEADPATDILGSVHLHPPPHVEEKRETPETVFAAPVADVYEVSLKLVAPRPPSKYGRIIPSGGPQLYAPW